MKAPEIVLWAALAVFVASLVLWWFSRRAFKAALALNSATVVMIKCYRAEMKEVRDLSLSAIEKDNAWLRSRNAQHGSTGGGREH